MEVQLPPLDPPLRPGSLSADATSGKRSLPVGPLTNLRRHDGRAAPFGSIRFAGSKGMPSKWVCVSNDSNIEDLVGVLTETWGLAPPPVLISVTGAASAEIKMRAKDRAIFERGLRNAAVQTGAWILTGGTHTGVMKMVGAMVQKCGAMGAEAPVCLGVAPFGAVTHHEALSSSYGRIHSYPKMEAKGTMQAPLDPNHTHFILVDDGTEEVFGGERAMRSKLEDKICQPLEHDTSYDERLPTPMVLLVVSGGIGTLDVVLYTLEKDRPVIVITDSGGIATRIYRYVQFGELPTLSATLDPRTGEPENKKEVETLHRMLPVIKQKGEELKGANRKQQLTFFTMSDPADDANDLETDILEAILSDCDTTEDAIMHAVKWSRPEIIDTQLAISRQIDAEGLVRAFQSALLVGTENKNAENVVKTLIQYNADARLVKFNRLFAHPCPDPFETIRSWRENARHAKKSRQWLNAEVAKVGVVDAVMQPPTPWSSGSPSHVSAEVDGFAVLSAELEEMGYMTNMKYRKRMEELRAPTRQNTMLLDVNAVTPHSKNIKKRKGPPPMFKRPKDNTVPPSFLDLMMWAVVVGEPELARLLWAKTKEPMRAAIIASRACAQMKARLGGDHLEAERLDKQAELYESWASGVLDECADVKEAIVLLTLVPQKRIGGDSTPTLLWDDSVMDQACNDDAPCRMFVARNNCQQLLINYYNGDYSSSRAKIAPSTTFSRLLVQMGLNLVCFLTLGYGRRLRCFNVVPVREVKSFEQDDDDDHDEEDDDDWDDAYFGSATPRKAASHKSGGLERMRKSLFGDFFRLVHFWNIPRVKFIVHSLSFFICIMLYMVLICGYDVLMHPWAWAWRGGTMEPSLPDQVSAQLIIELCIWAYTFGRLVEEWEQITGTALHLSLQKRLGKYISDGWNIIDLMSVLLMLMCFALRVVLWIDLKPQWYIHVGLSEEFARQIWEMLPGMLSSKDQNVIDFETRQVVMQLIQICFALSSLLNFIRFIDTLSIEPNLGIIVLNIQAMLADSAWMYFFLLWSALATSCALSGLLPQGQMDDDYFMRPFWISWRAVLGDMDLSSVYDLLGDSETPGQNLMGGVAVVVMYFYTLFVTVTFVNLMIAQMSQSYTKIEEKSAIIRKYAKVDLIREYKDKRATVPPPLIIVRFVALKIYQCLTCCKKAEYEPGFSDFLPYALTEEYLKREREHRAVYLKKAEADDEESTRLERAARDTAHLREDMEKIFEVTAGRFDRLEKVHETTASRIERIEQLLAATASAIPATTSTVVAPGTVPSTAVAARPPPTLLPPALPPHAAVGGGAYMYAAANGARAESKAEPSLPYNASPTPAFDRSSINAPPTVMGTTLGAYQCLPPLNGPRGALPHTPRGPNGCGPALPLPNALQSPALRRKRLAGGSVTTGL